MSVSDSQDKFRNKRYRARAYYRGEYVFLGRYTTPELARAAVDAFREQHPERRAGGELIVRR